MAVFLLQVGGQGKAFRGLRLHTVQQNDKGLVDGLQLFHHALLGLDVVFARDIADRAVCGDGKANGGMFAYHLARAHLGRRVERHLVVKPGAFHHAGPFALLVAHGAGHKVAHAVYHTGAQLNAALQLQAHRLFWHELRLRRHNGAPCGRLRQFIPRAAAKGLVADLRQNHQLHKPFDQRAFARAHRAHHANVDVAAGALGNVGVKVRVFHRAFLLFFSQRAHGISSLRAASRRTSSSSAFACTMLCGLVA